MAAPKTPRRLSIRVQRGDAMWAHRCLLGADELVYVLTTDKMLNYSGGRSRVAYIGTTQNGAWRIAGSVAARAQQVLGLRGVYEMSARIVTCRSRDGVKTWFKLERALLTVFRELYGEIPACNVKGRNYIWNAELGGIFQKDRIWAILDELR